MSMKIDFEKFKLTLKNKKLLPGREFLLFLFFFLISCSLWLMITLNKNYETEIEIPYRIKKVPDDIYAVAMEKEMVTLKVKDRGTVLTKYSTRNFMPLAIDYSEFQRQEGRLTLPSSVLKNHLSEQLAKSTDLVSIQPDTLIYYTQESFNKYPVAISGEISSAKQYEIGNIEITPDSVWVFGSTTATDTMTAIFTENVSRTEIRDSISFDVDLQKRQGLRYSVEKVNVKVPVTPYTEKSFELEIKGMGFPATYALKALPSKAKVVFNVNILQIDSIQPSDFEVGIMYGDIYGNKSERVALTLLKHPEAVRDIRIIPKEVEYILEYR